MTTDVQQFIGDLDGGDFEAKLSHVLSDVAGAVVDHSKKGKVVITLEMKQIGTQHQVQIDHQIKFDRPTAHGKRTEEATFITPMHVGTRGKLSFFPETQGNLFGKKGEALTHENN